MKIPHLKIVIIAALLLCSSAVLAKEQGFFDWLSQFLEKKYYHTQNDIRHVRVAGVDMWIPRNYFLGGLDREGIEQPSLLLQVILPNLEPRTEKNIDEFTKGLGYQKRARILLIDGANSTDLNYRYEATMSGVFPVHIAKPDKFGLSSMEISTGSSYEERLKYIYEKHLFYTKEDRKVKRYILCSVGAPDPGCEHHFQYKNIVIKFSYQMGYLKDWRRLEKKVIDLITKFETKPLEGKPI